jgi:hypothetical protein
MILKAMNRNQLYLSEIGGGVCILLAFILLNLFVF